MAGRGLYLYRVYWSDYEEYRPYELMHWRKFSEEEFARMCDEAVSHAFEELLRIDSGKRSEDRYWIGFCRADEIFDMAIRYLEEKYGFRRVRYAAVHGYSGYYIMDEDEVRRWTPKFLSKELVERIAKHNRELRETIAQH